MVMASCFSLLSEEQLNVLSLVSEGYSVFLTGKAGVGKSFLLRNILEKEIRKGGCYITASTGIAAVNIGGTTIHSFAGTGTGLKSPHELLAAVTANEEARNRWQKCRILVVDEVSMISATFFEKLEFVSRGVRGNARPFGGIQIVLCGDFHQLKPVSPLRSIYVKEEYCFKSVLWKDCLDFSIELSHVYRQTEPELLDLLNDIRDGSTVSLGSLSLLRYLVRGLKAKELDIVRLYPLKDEVRDHNDRILDILAGESMVFNSIDTGETQYINRKCSAPKTLSLKVECRVVLLKNLSSTLVNGLRGKVESFIGRYPFVRFDNGTACVLRENVFLVENESGEVTATRRQIPLDLAYAITIHKSQGMSFPFVEVHCKNIFEEGQLYVALSRAETLTGLRVLGFSPSKMLTNKDVVNFYQGLTNAPDCLDSINRPPNVRDTISLGVVVLRQNIVIASSGKPVPFPELVPQNQDTEFEFDRSETFGLKVALDWLGEHVVNTEELSLLKHLGLYQPHEMADLDVPVQNFIKCIWTYYHQVSSSKKDALVIIPKKKWQGINCKLHSFFCSELLYNKWRDCLVSLGVENVCIAAGTLHRKVCVLLSRAVYHAFLSNQANASREKFFSDPTNFVNGPVHFIDREAKGKLRDIGGWVLSEEIKASTAYIQKFKGSTTPSVKERVKEERKLKLVLLQMKPCKEDLFKDSRHKDSLEHIATYDKGNKTHITDDLFEFFVATGTLCTALFSDETYNRHKQHTLQYAWNSLVNNKEVKTHFENMLRLLESDEAKCHTDISSKMPHDIEEQDVIKSMTCIDQEHLDCSTKMPHDIEEQDVIKSMTCNDQEHLDISHSTYFDEENIEKQLSYSATVTQVNNSSSELAYEETMEIQFPLLSTINIPETESNKLHHRILHRFANVYSSEFVRKIKRSQQLKKKTALRQGLGGDPKLKRKRNMPGDATDFVCLLEDPQPKSYSHHYLKAHAFKGLGVFLSFTNIELHLLMECYGMAYTNSKKEELSKLLVEHLKISGEIMPFPENLTKIHLEDRKKMKPNNKVPRLALREQSNNVEKKQKRCCSHCGEPGHRKKYRNKVTCPKLQAEELHEQEKENVTY